MEWPKSGVCGVVTFLDSGHMIPTRMGHEHLNQGEKWFLNVCEVVELGLQRDLWHTALPHVPDTKIHDSEEIWRLARTCLALA